MSTISYVDSSGVTSVIYFDACLSETHTAMAEVTRHFVESGSTISDHVRVAPRDLQLEVFVTNTPLASIGRLVGQRRTVALESSGKTIGTVAGPVAPRISGGYTAPFKPPFGRRTHYAPTVVAGSAGSRTVYMQATLLTFPTFVDRVLDVWTELTRLQSERTLVSVETRLGLYTSQVITSISAPIRGEGHCAFSLSLSPYRTVESVTYSGEGKVIRIDTAPVTPAAPAPAPAEAVATESAEPEADKGVQKYVPYSSEKQQSLLDRGIVGGLSSAVN
jgi:hypothetical protein